MKLTHDERARLIEEAERIGVPSVSELIRQRALTGRVVVQQRAELSGPDRLELNRVGVNLHQLVKHLNLQGGGMSAVADIAFDARKALAQINALLLAGAGDGSEPH